MRAIMNRKNALQRGDTIVEVMIAIAVVGAAISGAYVLVSNTTKNNQAAQERSSATKVAETQLELLRSYTESQPLPTGKFCFDPANPTTPVPIVTGTLPAPDNNPSNYPLQCQIDDGDVADRFVAGIANDGADPNKYTVFVTWDAPTGERAQVSIAYKVYGP